MALVHRRDYSTRVPGLSLDFPEDDPDGLFGDPFDQFIATDQLDNDGAGGGYRFDDCGTLFEVGISPLKLDATDGLSSSPADESSKGDMLKCWPSSPLLAPDTALTSPFTEGSDPPLYQSFTGKAAISDRELLSLEGFPGTPLSSVFPPAAVPPASPPLTPVSRRPAAARKEQRTPSKSGETAFRWRVSQIGPKVNKKYLKSSPKMTSPTPHSRKSSIQSVSTPSIPEHQESTAAAAAATSATTTYGLGLTNTYYPISPPPSGRVPFSRESLQTFGAPGSSNGIGSISPEIGQGQGHVSPRSLGNRTTSTPSSIAMLSPTNKMAQVRRSSVQAISIPSSVTQCREAYRASSQSSNRPVYFPHGHQVGSYYEQANLPHSPGFHSLNSPPSSWWEANAPPLGTYGTPPLSTGETRNKLGRQASKMALNMTQTSAYDLHSDTGGAASLAKEGLMISYGHPNEHVTLGGASRGGGGMYPYPEDVGYEDSASPMSSGPSSAAPSVPTSPCPVSAGPGGGLLRTKGRRKPSGNNRISSSYRPNTVLRSPSSFNPPPPPPPPPPSSPPLPPPTLPASAPAPAPPRSRSSTTTTTATTTMGFVNLTAHDSESILTGVAPSGSSKTKAKRDKEAAWQRRLLRDAAVKAVAAAGGDLEVLKKEGGGIL